jgi:hypothetical protein
MYRWLDGIKGHCKSRGLYFIPWKRKQNSSIETGIFVHHKNTAVKRVEFVSDRLSYIVLGRRLCKIVV